MYEGTCTSENFFSPVNFMTDEALRNYVLKAHSADYLNNLENVTISPKMERRIGFPVSKKLVERELVITKGTIQCCHYALKYGVSMNIAGGTHHAYPDKGEGFCLLNDVGVASHYLLDNQLAKKILIIDLDVHQGNGSSVMFQEDERVFTFSMHGAENYPLKKEISDLDIALPTYTEDEVYLDTLKENLPKLIQEVKPDFLFFISGVDIMATDKLGKLSVSLEGCKARDKFVFEVALRANLPIVVTMGGGYSPRIADIIEAHCNTYRTAELLYRDVTIQ
jgi:acetoin utilization deacetylase AcuC-like enzyme